MKIILKQGIFFLVFMSIVLESTGYPFWPPWSPPSPFHSNVDSDSRWRPFGFRSRPTFESHEARPYPRIENPPEFKPHPYISNLPIPRREPFGGFNRDSTQEDIPLAGNFDQWPNRAGWARPFGGLDLRPQLNNWLKQPLDIFKASQESTNRPPPPLKDFWSSGIKGGFEGGIPNIFRKPFSLFNRPNLKPEENKSTEDETTLEQEIGTKTEADDQETSTETDNEETTTENQETKEEVTETEKTKTSTETVKEETTTKAKDTEDSTEKKETETEAANTEATSKIPVNQNID